MAIATWEDVAVALGRPTSGFTADQQAQITHWLNGIEMFIQLRLGDLALLDQQTLKYVETEAAAAKVPAPGATSGESSTTVALDDASVTRRWEVKKVSADDITDTWWAMLSPSHGALAFSTRPRHVPDLGDPLPCTRYQA